MGITLCGECNTIIMWYGNVPMYPTTMHIALADTLVLWLGQAYVSLALWENDDANWKNWGVEGRKSALLNSQCINSIFC